MRPERTSAILALSALCACSSFGATDEPSPSTNVPDGGAPDGDAVAGPKSGLVLAFDFEDATPTSAADSSGKGNDGTVFGGRRVPGVHGNALDFAGGGDGNVSVVVPSSRSLDIGGGELTIAFWISIPIPLPAGDQVVLGKVWSTGSLDPPWYQYGIELNGEGKALELYVGEGTAALPPRVSVIPAFGTWSHVAFVVGGGTAIGYVNGVASTPLPMAVPITPRGTGLALGIDAAGAQPFVGKLDELRIYDRALTADEIAQLATR